MEEHQLRLREHGQRQFVNRLRGQVFGQADPAMCDTLLDALQQAEGELSAIERERAAAEVAAAERDRDGAVRSHEVRGAATTQLSATVSMRMAQLPTSLYHLFDRAVDPLVSCRVDNVGVKPRRVRVVSMIDGYSAHAVDTAEVAARGSVTVDQLPTLFGERVERLHEVSTATVNVLVEDLDGRVEVHTTRPVLMLPRTTAPLAVRDPATGRWSDLSRYLGAYVTPNAPTIMTLLRDVAEQHPQRRLVGYQGSRDAVQPQIEAVFHELRRVGITYVHSVVAFSPDDGMASQRIRLPRESLADKQANCIDGTVLVASLIEAMSMNPAIVVVPGHAMVGWETWPGSGEWRYLETTMIGGSATFEQACASAERTASRFEELSRQVGDPSRFRRWPLDQLRSIHRIVPME